MRLSTFLTRRILSIFIFVNYLAGKFTFLGGTEPAQGRLPGIIPVHWNLLLFTLLLNFAVLKGS